MNHYAIETTEKSEKAKVKLAGSSYFSEGAPPDKKESFEDLHSSSYTLKTSMLPFKRLGKIPSLRSQLFEKTSTQKIYILPK